MRRHRPGAGRRARRRCARSTATSPAAAAPPDDAVYLCSPVDRGGHRADRRDHRPADPATGRRCGPPCRRDLTIARPPHRPPPPPEAGGARSDRARREHRAAAARRAAARATSDAPVLIVVGDDVSTGDMAPDGAIGMSCGRTSPAAPVHVPPPGPRVPRPRAEWGGGLIVGGHNYGQGSSREQAALAAAAPRRPRGGREELRPHPPANLVARASCRSSSPTRTITTPSRSATPGRSMASGPRSRTARRTSSPGSRAAASSRCAPCSRTASGPSCSRAACASSSARDNPWRCCTPESVRRRQAGVLVVGAAEPEVPAWLRAAGSPAARGARRRRRAGGARRGRRPTS